MEISHGIETNGLPDKKLQLNDNVELMGLSEGFEIHKWKFAR